MDESINQTMAACELMLALGVSGGCAHLPAGVAVAVSQTLDAQAATLEQRLREREERPADAVEFPGADPRELRFVRGRVISLIRCPWRASSDQYVWLRVSDRRSVNVSLGPSHLFDGSSLTFEPGEFVEVHGFDVPPELRNCIVAEDIPLFAASVVRTTKGRLTVRDRDGRVVGGPRTDGAPRP
jgi:hypothetical protein